MDSTTPGVLICMDNTTNFVKEDEVINKCILYEGMNAWFLNFLL